MIEWKILWLCMAYMCLPAAVVSEDFDQSITQIGRLFVNELGLSSKYLLSAGTDYPPIAEDVSFWCITP